MDTIDRVQQEVDALNVLAQQQQQDRVAQDRAALKRETYDRLWGPWQKLQVDRENAERERVEVEIAKRRADQLAARRAAEEVRRLPIQREVLAEVLAEHPELEEFVEQVGLTRYR